MPQGLQGGGILPATVVVPAYNAAQWLGRAVDGALAQDVGLEVIVVDDGSTDETRDVLASVGDPRLRWTSLPGNRGVHWARNVGLEMARGDVVIFLDADDELLPGSVDRAVEVMAGLPASTGVLFANGITDEGELTGIGVEAAREVGLPELLCGDVFLRHKSCFGTVRRACIGAVRWELPSFDFVFWRRLERDWGTYALPEVLMRYHRGANPASLTAQRANRRRTSAMAGRASRVYESFVSEFGDLLAEHCPNAYTDHLWGLAVTSVLAGRRRVGLEASLRVLRHRRDAASLALPLLAMGPARFARWAHARR